MQSAIHARVRVHDHDAVGVLRIVGGHNPPADLAPALVHSVGDVGLHEAEATDQAHGSRVIRARTQGRTAHAHVAKISR